MIKPVIQFIKRIRNGHLQWQAHKASLPGIVRIPVHYAETILVSILVVLFIREYLVQSSRVVSGSMIPTLGIQDRVLVTKWQHRFYPVERGAVVLFESPNNDKKEYVKRVVATGGDRIRINSGVIYINDKPRSFPGVLIRADQYTMPEISVPENHYFMMGDNRRYSQDSRYWGVVPHEDIIGHAFLIYWPFNRAELIW